MVGDHDTYSCFWCLIACRALWYLNPFYANCYILWLVAFTLNLDSPKVVCYYHIRAVNHTSSTWSLDQVGLISNIFLRIVFKAKIKIEFKTYTIWYGYNDHWCSGLHKLEKLHTLMIPIDFHSIFNLIVQFIFIFFSKCSKHVWSGNKIDNGKDIHC